jgi:hypothetical protein
MTPYTKTWNGHQYEYSDGHVLLFRAATHNELGHKIALGIAGGTIDHRRVETDLHATVYDQILNSHLVPSFCGQTQEAIRLRNFMSVAQWKR